MVSPDGRNPRIFPSPIPVWVEYALVAWSADSSTLYVASSYNGPSRLHALDVRTGKSRPVADYGTAFRFGVQETNCLSACLSPDGKSIVTTLMSRKSDLWILDGYPPPGALAHSWPERLSQIFSPW